MKTINNSLLIHNDSVSYCCFWSLDHGCVPLCKRKECLRGSRPAGTTRVSRSTSWCTGSFPAIQCECTWLIGVNRGWSQNPRWSCGVAAYQFDDPPKNSWSTAVWACTASGRTPTSAGPLSLESPSSMAAAVGEVAIAHRRGRAGQATRTALCMCFS